MNDYLSEFYKRLIFRDMPVEQFAQYCDYVKANDFNGNMKDWKSLLAKDPHDPTKLDIDGTTKLYVRLPALTEAELGDPANPASQEDLIKLYKAFQSAFRNMDADRAAFKDNKKATEFLDTYFGKDASGQSRLFGHATASARADSLIQNELKNFLERYQDKLQFILQNWGVLNDDFTYQNLLDGIQSKKYNSNAKFQRNFQKIVSHIIYNAESNEEEFRRQLRLHHDEKIPDFSEIRDGFNDNNVNHQQLAGFQAEFPTILRELYTNTKAYDVFKQYDGGKISKPLEKAKETLNYNDANSDNFVKPKREKTLTIPQIISDFVADTYADTIEKYVKFSGDRMYFSEPAKAIVSALKKAKPTDGLDGLLKEAGDLDKKLKAAGKFTASKHAKWLVGTLNEIKADPNMKGTFERALRSGTHMKALVQELVFKAVKEDKIKEAETALEVLSVMKYGYTTSKTMDALRKTDVTLFSDKGLSWNKNEGVAFVTAAMDKSLKFAIEALGLGLTVAGNAIRLSHSKIKKTKGSLNLERKARLAQNDADKAALDQKIVDEYAAKDMHEQTLTNLAGGTDDASYQNKFNFLNTAMTNATDALQQAKSDAESGPLMQMGIWLKDAQNQTNPDYNTVLQYYYNALEVMQNNGANWGAVGTPTLPATLTAPGAELDGVDTALDAYMNTIQTNNDDYSNNNATLEDLVHARESLEAISAQITRHEQEAQNWDDTHMDKVEHLINYWNMLERGRNTRTGPMYSWFGRKKTAEKKFGKIKGALIAKAMKNKVKMAA